MDLNNNLLDTIISQTLRDHTKDVDDYILRTMQFLRIKTIQEFNRDYILEVHPIDGFKIDGYKDYFEDNTLKLSITQKYRIRKKTPEELERDRLAGEAQQI